MKLIIVNSIVVVCLICLVVSIIVLKKYKPNNDLSRSVNPNYLQEYNWLDTTSPLYSETDPVLTNWLDTNTYIKTESDPVFVSNHFIPTNRGYITVELLIPIEY